MDSGYGRRAPPVRRYAIIRAAALSEATILAPRPSSARAELPGELARTFVRVGAVWVDRARLCELDANGKTLVGR
jgi:hypothetical protein